MFRLADGRNSLYQWDTDVKVLFDEPIDGINEIHFNSRYCKSSLTVDVVRTGTEIYATIPNILLQKNCDIVAYAFHYGDDGSYTTHRKVFEVEGRPKPSGYVYVETEVKCYENLEKRIKDLEERETDVDITVDSELNIESENPVQNKAVAKAVEKLTEDISKVNIPSGIVNTASGETIVLSDSAEGELEGLRVSGKSEQVTTTGANLLDLSGPDQNYTTSGGITVKRTGDGGLTFKGTATSDTINVWVSGAFGTGLQTLFTLPAGKYYVNGVLLFVDQKCITDGLTTEKPGGIFTLSADANITGVRALRAIVGKTYDTIFYPMVARTDTAIDWEPYTGGPSPNPDFPQEIESAGDGGVVEVEVYEGNFFDHKKLVNGGSETFTISDDGYTVKVTGGKKGHSGVYFRMLDVSKFAGKTMYIKADSILSTQSGTYKFAQVEIENSENRREYFGLYSGINVISEIAIPNDVIRIDITLFAHNSSTPLETANTVIFNGVQFTFDGARSWTPYKEPQTLTIPTPNGLRGIKVTDASIATYTDEIGQMWCADEIDFERGIYTDNIIEIELTGSEEWITTSENEYRTNNYGNILPKAKYDGAFCTHYRHAELYERGVHGTIIRGIDGVQIFICDNRFNNDVEAFKAYLAEQKANGNPVVVLCRRITPIETPLTAEELSQYKALHVNYPTTTIISEAHMDIKYGADTKNYIDNKFTTLTNAILSMGGNV